MNQRSLFDPPKRQRARDAGTVCSKRIERAVAELLTKRPSCEAVGRVLETFHDQAKHLEQLMHD